jgi:hypothetical protein
MVKGWVKSSCAVSPFTFTRGLAFSHFGIEVRETGLEEQSRREKGLIQTSRLPSAFPDTDIGGASSSRRG